MTYPRNIFIGPPEIGKAAELKRRLDRLERLSGLGHQRAARSIITQTEITVATYGLSPLLDIDVYVPEGGWVAFYGSATDTLTLGPDAISHVHLYGAIFETTDMADPFYAGQGVYQHLHSSPPNSSEAQDLNLRALSGYGQAALSGGAPVALDPLIYRPASAGNKTYRMDFRRERSHTTNRAYIDECWFGVEVF